jgi:hypothetical protein
VQSSKVALKENNTKLTVENVSEKDSGQYECIARNRFGEKRAAAQLKLKIADKSFLSKVENEPKGFKSSLRFTKMPSDTEAVEGSSVRLNCNADQSNKLSWLKVIKN